MFRLIRWFFSLVLLAGVVYFAVAVPLGEKTLWQHARAIAGTRESQTLVEEVKRKAGLGAPPAAEQAPAGKQREPGGESQQAGKSSPFAGRDPASDKLSDEERRLLRRLIRDRLSAAPP
jgi:hypothetical protein